MYTPVARYARTADTIRQDILSTCSVSKVSTVIGSRRELVVNLVYTADADATQLSSRII